MPDPMPPLQPNAQPQPVPYATPRPSEPPTAGVVGAAMLMFGGLAMIVLGGCFLMGVVSLYNRNTIQLDPYAWPPALTLLPWVLYLLAFGSFAVAGWMLLTAVRWIYHATR